MPGTFKPPEIPEKILRDLREMRNLEPDDTSKDHVIKAQDPMDNLRQLSIWEFGDPSWADTFVIWMKGLGILKGDS